MEQEPGCTITVELYEPLTHTALAELIDQLEQQCKYVSLICKLNDRQINKVPSTQQWDITTEEADIRFRQNGELVVYNQGIKVCSYQRYRLGVGGEIVTKQNLTVNFARNEIMHNCPVWAKIQAAILAYSNARATILPQQTSTTTTTTRTRRPAITEADRVRLANQAKDKQLDPSQARHAQLFLPLCSTRNISCSQLFYKYAGKFTVPPRDGYHWDEQNYGKQLMLHKLAFPLSRDTLTRWGVNTGEELQVALRNSSMGGYTFKFAPWRELLELLGHQKSLLAEKELSRIEAIVLATLRKHAANLMYRIKDGSWIRCQRIINIGASRGDDSWSDGESFIALSRSVISRYKISQNAWFTYGMLIIHEMCHHTATLKRHAHSAKFYREFHAAIMDHQLSALSWFAYRCNMDCPSIAESINRRLTRTELAEIDRNEARARRLQVLPQGTESVALPAEEVRD
jgi:hypothetical protein